MRPPRGSLLALTVAWLSGCGAPQPDAKPTLPPTPAAHTEGRGVYDNGCASCHDSSRDGSPRLGYLAAWSRRLDQGEETLVRHAIEGVGLMPPRGDNEALTDDQVAAAVRYMIYRAGLDIPARH